MKRLKEVIVEQREKDQKEFTKRMADILQYKEIVTWLQQPKIRETFYDENNKVKTLNEQEMALLNSLREIINPRISSYNYEKIWKRVLRDAAKLGMKLDSDQDETATIVHSNVCKNAIQLQSEIPAVEKITESDVQFQTEMSNAEEVIESNVQFQTEISNAEEIKCR
ncbi:unnamed protein product [Wuchereria bancrofti]|uniref:Caprin-1 dimerization domain-containing protein n=1 Tax=Wuchereria bancrofti TaxID=6293 RepID=A0A3P7FX92_WUCBA|nr:unnamed protein product [Wuchereria bancrofti]